MTRWIKNGELEAFRTPGGHFRVAQEDLRSFASGQGIELEKLSSGKKILVVEDDPAVMKVISTALKKSFSRYSLILSSDGFDAGIKFSEQTPELIILDLMLPGMDGFEICRNIRKKDSSVRILAVSGYPTKENIKKIREAGADDFLSKPFVVKDFVRRVSALLDR